MRHLKLAAIAVLASGPASAATAYLDFASFSTAISGGAAPIVEDFSIASDGQLIAPTTFASGLTVSPVAPSPENAVMSGTLQVSIDNTGTPTTPASPLTSEVTFDFGGPVAYFWFEFSDPSGKMAVSRRGIGNDSGTTLTAGGFTYDFADMFSTDPGYTGFFGVVGGPGEFFDSAVFSSNGTGDLTDDDFAISEAAFATPIPVPGALPLAAAALGALSLLRVRRNA